MDTSNGEEIVEKVESNQALSNVGGGRVVTEFKASFDGVCERNQASSVIFTSIFTYIYTPPSINNDHPKSI